MRNIYSAILLAYLFASHAHGHGTPIHLDVVDGRIVASHQTDVFAPPIFGQPDESDDFAQTNSLPGLGQVILWEIPGLEIFGMNDSASLSIEILARPVIGSTPAEHRLLWYWNPETDATESSPASFHVLGTGMRSRTLQPDDQDSPPPLMLADSVAGETGYHNHSLVFYALDDDEIAPAGVYGFFARFTSNSYAASDPFLLVFNYFADNELLPSASLAIHEAATLPGDFDLDDDVDGRDFLEWQRLFGSTTRTVADASLNGIVDAADLEIWQQNYGTVLGQASVSAVHVPEPTSVAMLLIAANAFAAFRRNGRSH